MAPGHFPEAAYGPEERARLRQIADASIRHGFEHGRPLGVVSERTLPALHAVRATFVTLQREGRLRGCIGTLEARQIVTQDVADHAFAAAFRDPRFRPLQSDELAGLELKISVLSPPEPLAATSEAELLRMLRPGIDGLILEDGPRKATFLPSVWTELPDAPEFVAALKRKAGLPPARHGPQLRVWRYTTEEF